MRELATEVKQRGQSRRTAEQSKPRWWLIAYRRRP